MMHRKKFLIKIDWVQNLSPLKVMTALIDPCTINAILPIADVENRCIVIANGCQFQVNEDILDFYQRISPYLGERYERDDE